MRFREQAPGDDLEARDESDKYAIEAARRHYAAAEKRSARSPDAFYPALNVIAIDVIKKARNVSGARFNAVREILAARLRDDAEFWSSVGALELSVYRALNADALAPRLDALIAGFEDLRTRWPAQWMWSSVNDQARFVLPRYSERVADPTEKQAAAQLLQTIESYAAPADAAPPAPRAVRRKKAAGARKPRRRRARKG